MATGVHGHHLILALSPVEEARVNEHVLVATLHLRMVDLIVYSLVALVKEESRKVKLELVIMHHVQVIYNCFFILTSICAY